MFKEGINIFVGGRYPLVFFEIFPPQLKVLSNEEWVDHENKEWIDSNLGRASCEKNSQYNSRALFL